MWILGGVLDSTAGDCAAVLRQFNDEQNKQEKLEVEISDSPYSLFD
jgi:hypothetical protein